MATQRKTPNTLKKSMNNKTQKQQQQPLFDISNFNLIPTSTLRKLCSTSSSSSKLFENVIPKSPFPLSKSDSNTTKPNFNNSPNNNSTSIASETSVASSNFNPVGNPTGRDDEAVVYNRRQTTKKSNLEATALPFGSSLHKTKERRKATAEPFISLPPTSTEDKGKAIAETLSSSSPEIEKDKGKGVSVLSTPVSGNKKTKGIHEPSIPGWDDEVVVYSQRKDTNKSSLEADALPFASSLHENKKHKRKEIDELFLSVPPTSTKDKGKAIAERFSSPPPDIEKHKGERVVVLSTPASGNKKKKGIHTLRLHENKKDKRKYIAEPFLSLPSTSAKDKGKAIAESFSSSSPEIKEDKGKGVAVQSTPVSGNKKKGIQEPFMSSSPKTVKAKTKAISLEQAPSDEKTAEEKVGDLSQSLSTLKKTRRKERADTSVFSCPTLPKKRNNRTEVNRAGDINPSGSWTDANAKRTKRRHSEQKAAAGDSLPQDFINYWKEHYKAVDEFELPEEEVSDCDLD